MNSTFTAKSTLFAATAVNLFTVAANAGEREVNRNDPLFKLREQAKSAFAEKCGITHAAQLPWSEFDQETLEILIQNVLYNIQFSCVPTEMENMPGTAKNQGDGELEEQPGTEL